MSKPTSSLKNTLDTSFNKTDVTLHKEELLHDEYFQIKRVTLSHPSYSGKTIGPFTREIFERGHAVICLPYDPVRDEVVLIEQFRPGPYVHGSDKCWLIETVAGIIDEGETAENVAIRETQEESGCKITKLYDAGFYYPTSGASTESMKCFVGMCDTSNVGGLHGLEEESEDIRAFAYPFKDALAACQAGEFQNMSLVVMLQWLALNKSKLF